MIDADFNVVVLADGVFPHKPKILELLTKAEKVICCDGSAGKLLHFGRTPDYVVGDLDSVSDQIKKMPDINLIYNPDQETNDLTKAVQFCIEKGWGKIAILGATGDREDHTFANVSLLASYQQKLEKVVMISDFGVFVPINQTTEFTSEVGQQVSIFSLTPDCPISVRGLKYPIKERKLLAWWEGTLNEAVGQFFIVQLHGIGKVIVYKTI